MLRKICEQSARAALRALSSTEPSLLTEQKQALGGLLVLSGQRALFGSSSLACSSSASLRCWLPANTAVGGLPSVTTQLGGSSLPGSGAAATSLVARERMYSNSSASTSDASSVSPDTDVGSEVYYDEEARVKVPNFYVGLDNLRDNPGARKKRIRVGRGDSGRRGNYGGRGMKGQKARGRGLHILFDGGQLGLLKFPISRERPPYEVLYKQLGLSRVVEFIQLGLLDPTRTITMKDLQDSGCVSGKIKYGVRLYGKARLPCPLDIQVTACDDASRMAVEGAGGKVTRVYYTQQGLEAVLHPAKYTAKRVPLPAPAVAWHPKYNTKFDAIGLIPPAVSQVTAAGAAKRA